MVDLDEFAARIDRVAGLLPEGREDINAAVPMSLFEARDVLAQLRRARQTEAAAAVLLEKYHRLEDWYLKVAGAAPQSVYDQLGWTIVDTSRQALEMLDVDKTVPRATALLAVLEAAWAFVDAPARQSQVTYDALRDALAHFDALE